MNHFYERNNYILEHDINKKFEEVLWMTEDEFRAWVVEMRKTIVYAWDELGIPPRVGYNEDAIIAQLDKLDSLLLVISGSIIRRNSLALGKVVLIASCLIKDMAIFLNVANRCLLVRFNLRKP